MSFSRLGALTDLSQPTGRLCDVRVPAALLPQRNGFEGLLERDAARGDLVLDAGRVVAMTPPGGAVQPVLADLGGRLVTPPLVEAHCHLDKCFTAHRLDVCGGTLADAIAVQNADALGWTADDIRARAGRGLSELYGSGCALVRTHVDWTVDPADPSRPPLAWDVLGDLAEEWRGRLTLQRSALLSLDDVAHTAAIGQVAARIARDGGVLGAFVHNHPARDAHIGRLVELADRHGLALDFHVDEGLAPELDGVERIARAVTQRAFEGPVLLGHGCSLSMADAQTRMRRIGLLAQAGIGLVCLPASNLYLQDRGHDTPRLRGLPPVGELMRAGVRVAVGTDNVRDAFCPVGRHDPLRALSLAVLAAHLDPPLDRWLPLVTADAAGALRADAWTIADLPAADLLAWDACEVAALL